MLAVIPAQAGIQWHLIPTGFGFREGDENALFLKRLIGEA
jgi:hypothetical protein